MNKEILRKNIEEVIMQPCLAHPMYPWDKSIRPDGWPSDKKYISLKTTPDDSYTRIYIFDDDGKPMDFVDDILRMLPEKYKNKIATIKHDPHGTWNDYLPVFETDTQAKWNESLRKFYDAKQAWCDNYGCD